MSGVNDNFHGKRKLPDVGSEEEADLAYNIKKASTLKEIEESKNLQVVLDNSLKFKRALHTFLGCEADKFSAQKDPVDLSKKLAVLEDKVSTLAGDLFLKHSELELLSRDHSEDLTRGLAYVRGIIFRELDQEVAKNEAKGKAIEELLERVKKLEELTGQ